VTERPRAIDWLLKSDEPAIRYRTRTWLLAESESNAKVKGDRKAAWDGPIVSTLLDFTPESKKDPYRKWWGVHWRLVSLAYFALPVDRADVRAKLDEAIDIELAWIANPRRLDAPQRLREDGLYLSDASTEGNGLYAASRLGHEADDRVEPLVEALLKWQWPDGGWNCDGASSGYRSSFHESWATAIGLASYHHATGNADALAAARRTAELLLEHRLFRTLKDDQPIHSSFVTLHWPQYWHYDYLGGLRVLNAVDYGLLEDPRAADALDLLESKQLLEGRFQAGRAWWQRPSNPTSPVDVIDWGKGRPSEMLTLQALSILKSAGR
jgi:hypothetical protein